MNHVLSPEVTQVWNTRLEEVLEMIHELGRDGEITLGHIGHFLSEAKCEDNVITMSSGGDKRWCFGRRSSMSELIVEDFDGRNLLQKLAELFDM